MAHQAQILGPARAELGEGPVWDPETGLLHWLDILGEIRLVTDPASGETRQTKLPRRISCLARRRGGGWMLAGGHGLWADTADDPPLVSLPPDSPGMFNDGKCDANGRLWIGTATAEPRFDCSLWLLGPDQSGRVQPERRAEGVAMSNGIGFSPDGRVLYHADSTGGSVMAHDLDPETGALSRPWLFYKVDEPAGRYGASQVKPVPDGLSVDAEGHVWLAIWGGYGLQRIAPDGREVDRITLPTPRVSSCCFGGPDLKTLFITTACEGASAAERAADPAMGALFSVELAVPGLPVATFDLPLG